MSNLKHSELMIQKDPQFYIGFVIQLVSALDSNKYNMFAGFLAERHGVIRLPDTRYREESGLACYTEDNLSFSTDGVLAMSREMALLSTHKALSKYLQVSIFCLHELLEEIEPGSGKKMLCALVGALSEREGALGEWLAQKTIYSPTQALRDDLLEAVKEAAPEGFFDALPKGVSGRIATRFSWPAAVKNSTKQAKNKLMMSRFSL
ncbi:hypothetical protein ACYPKM_00250 [Pseudomonas aeruginosa]